MIKGGYLSNILMEKSYFLVKLPQLTHSALNFPAVLVTLLSSWAETGPIWTSYISPRIEPLPKEQRVQKLTSDQFLPASVGPTWKSFISQTGT